MKEKLSLESLYNLYVSEMFTYGCNLGFEENIVKDAIHDIFVKIAINTYFLKNVSNVKFYLLRSLKNRLLDINKLNKKETILNDINQSVSETPFNIDVNVEDILIEEEEQLKIKQIVQQMLNSLTNRQREIVYLRYIQELDYEQISELLQINIHGCRKLVSKAIITLREKYSILILCMLHFVK